MQSGIIRVVGDEAPQGWGSWALAKVKEYPKLSAAGAVLAAPVVGPGITAVAAVATAVGLMQSDASDNYAGVPATTPLAEL